MTECWAHNTRRKVRIGEALSLIGLCFCHEPRGSDELAFVLEFELGFELKPIRC